MSGQLEPKRRTSATAHVYRWTATARGAWMDRGVISDCEVELTTPHGETFALQPWEAKALGEALINVVAIARSL